MVGRLAAEANHGGRPTTADASYLDRTISTRSRYPSLSHRRVSAPRHHQPSDAHHHHRAHPGRRPSTSAQTRTNESVSFDASARHRPSASHGCQHAAAYPRPQRRHNREGVGTILGVGTSLVARDYANAHAAHSWTSRIPTAIPDLAPELLEATDEQTLRDDPLFTSPQKSKLLDNSDKLDLLLQQNAAIWNRIASLETRQMQLVRSGMGVGAAMDLPFGLSRPPSPTTPSSADTHKSAIQPFHCGHLSDDVTYVRQRENALVLSIVAFIMVLVIALVWLVVPLGPHISPIFSTGSSLVWSCLSSWLSLRLLEGYKGWGVP